MSIGALQAGQQDPRLIEIDTARVMDRKPQHYGVVDVGSNSMRLVVYDDLSRSPFPRFNEKSLVALGDGIDDDGNFTAETIERALKAMDRFKSISDAMGVPRVDVLATEATRRAGNGAELLAEIRKRTGFEPRLLSGEDEATYATMGVISGFFQPRGLVGDIGGGSLEVAEALGDHVGERKVSMPLGALPVRKMMKDDPKEAKKRVDELLEADLPPMLTEPVFYAVGGGWRALARVHMAMNDWPVGVVHAYDLPADDVAELAKSIAKMSVDEVAELPDVPSRRIDTLAASALVMWRVLRKLRPERVVFSALGLREGWLYSQLSEEERYRDPLVEGALAIGLPDARVPAFSEALGRWTDHIFPGEMDGDRRIRIAACALTDIAWRDHQKVRAAESFQRLLQFPFIGITHPERAFLATALMARYGGKPAKLDAPAAEILTPTEQQKAEVLGRTMLLGHRFSASVPDILEQAKLTIETDLVRLEIAGSANVPDSDAVQTRLAQLAKVLGMKSEISLSGSN